MSDALTKEIQKQSKGYSEKQLLAYIANAPTKLQRDLRQEAFDWILANTPEKIGRLFAEPAEMLEYDEVPYAFV